jgi:hypothetical protein
LAKNGLDDILCKIFTNSSGHPSDLQHLAENLRESQQILDDARLGSLAQPQGMHPQPQAPGEVGLRSRCNVSVLVVSYEQSEIGQKGRYVAIWGQCNDHNFLRFSTIFGEKIGVYLKNQCYDQNFA